MKKIVVSFLFIFAVFITGSLSANPVKAVQHECLWMDVSFPPPDGGPLPEPGVYYDISCPQGTCTQGNPHNHDTIRPGETKHLDHCDCNVSPEGACLSVTAHNMPASCHDTTDRHQCGQNGQGTIQTQVTMSCENPPPPPVVTKWYCQNPGQCANCIVGVNCPATTYGDNGACMTACPLPPKPGCNTDCTSKPDICEQAVDGCNVCRDAGGGVKKCQSAPQCNVPCSDSNQCPSPAPGVDCNVCAPQTSGGSKTCRPSTSQCGGYCDNTSVSCESNSGCTCNLTTNKCEAPPPTVTTGPTATATPTTVPSCQAGTQCHAGGAECNGGVCSNINPETGIGSCNCQGGGCVPGNSCDRPEPPIPTPDVHGQVCYNEPIGGKTAICCRKGNLQSSPWEIDRCLSTSPTPTPVQPTLEVTMIATPTPNPNRPTPTGTHGASNRLSQRWVCLSALPCSDPANNCSGEGTPDHRVKLSAKSTTDDPSKPLGGKPTYIFECLQTSTGNKCTTGDETLDNQAVGSSSLAQLAASYGYTFGGMFYENGMDVAPNPIPDTENNNGNFGAREWESYTDSNVNRLFLAMNDFDPNGVGGEIGAQQQGILAFIQGGSKKCVQIKWDPYGEISDKWSLKPVSGAQVLLYRKSADGTFSVFTGNDILSGVENPVTSNQNGQYSFMVPDGIYRLEIKAPGYKLYQAEIEQKDGQQVEHKVALEPKEDSIVQKMKEFLENLIR